MIILLEGSLKCDRSCKYCYQKILHSQSTSSYDKEAIARVVRFLYKKYRDGIVLHGGEPLLLPLRDIEYFLRLSYELSGKSAICTNGLLINEDHIKLFKKYNTSVSLSIDGFHPQNILRCNKEETRRVLENISILSDENIFVTLMIVAHKLNYNYIPEFIARMSRIVKSFKVNHEGFTSYSISPTILYLLWKKLANMQILPSDISIEPITSFVNSLLGIPDVDCFLTPCDPFCTERAKRVLGNGRIMNCYFVPTQASYTFKPSYKRYYILERRDCRNCKYWNYCYGGCAAYLYHKDKYCYAYYKIFDYLANFLHKRCYFTEVFPNEDTILDFTFQFSGRDSGADFW